MRFLKSLLILLITTAGKVIITISAFIIMIIILTMTNQDNLAFVAILYLIIMYYANIAAKRFSKTMKQIEKSFSENSGSNTSDTVRTGYEQQYYYGTGTGGGHFSGSGYSGETGETGGGFEKSAFSGGYGRQNENDNSYKQNSREQNKSGSSGSGDADEKFVKDSEEFFARTVKSDQFEILLAISRLCGYIANADSEITAEEKNVVAKLLAQTDYSQSLLSELNHEFEAGAEDFFDPFQTCCTLKSLFQNRYKDPAFIITVLLTVIYSDNIVRDSELEKLRIISRYFSLSYAEINKKIRDFRFLHQFRQNHEYSQSRRQEDNSYRNSGNRSRENTDYGIEDRTQALSILGLDPTASERDIKRAYLDLMKEFHPDRIKSKGITGSLLKEYEDRCKIVTQAYNYLK